MPNTSNRKYQLTFNKPRQTTLQLIIFNGQMVIVSFLPICHSLHLRESKINIGWSPKKRFALIIGIYPFVGQKEGRNEQRVEINGAHATRTQANVIFRIGNIRCREGNMLDVVGDGEEGSVLKALIYAWEERILE
jgi:hypothetical protein